MIVSVLRRVRRTVPTLALACAAALALPLQAEEAAAVRPKADAAKGQAIASAVCAACHNADGNSVIPVNPRLAGLPAEYIYKQLVDLARKPDDSQRRENAVMGAFASQLSDDDRRNVAAWFSSQTPKPGVAQSKEEAEAGARLYRTGVPERAVPACAGCHGPTGAGLPVVYPRLAGQHPDYAEAQLKAFRDGTRRNYAPMSAIAARLSEGEMKALSQYVSGLRAQ